MTALPSLLAALEAKAGGLFAHRARSVPWHSATFVGESHELRLSYENATNAAALLDGLADHEFDLVGYWIADIRGEHVITSDGFSCVRLEALTFESD